MGQEFNSNITKDFGTVYKRDTIAKGKFDVTKALKQLLTEDRYDLNHNDICSIVCVWKTEQVEVSFKFVHWSVPTMVTEPYWIVIFKTV